MIEIQILIAFVAVWALIAIPSRAPLKGFAITLAWFVGVLGALFLLSVALEKWDDFLQKGPVKAFRESKAGRLILSALVGVAAAAAAGAIAGFGSIFLAKALSGTPEGQLQVMRGCTFVAAGAAGLSAAYVAFARSAR